MGRQTFGSVPAVGERNHLQLVWSERIQRERFGAGAEQPGPSSWRPVTAGQWWLFGDAVVGFAGRVSGDRHVWECYLHGRLTVMRHSLVEAQAFFEDRYGVLAWQRVDLPKIEAQPSSAATSQCSRPRRGSGSRMSQTPCRPFERAGDELPPDA